MCCALSGAGPTGKAFGNQTKTRRRVDQTKRIFLVEDDEEIARNLALLLRTEGFTVTRAATQREAVALFAENAFELALVDISLPEGNGFAVCTEIKQTQDIPVIFLTASGDEASVVTGLNMGTDDYITKPFRPRKRIVRFKSRWSCTAFRSRPMYRKAAHSLPYAFRSDDSLTEKSPECKQKLLDWRQAIRKESHTMEFLKLKISARSMARVKIRSSRSTTFRYVLKKGSLLRLSALPSPESPHFCTQLRAWTDRRADMCFWAGRTAIPRAAKSSRFYAAVKWG